jgi:hypothetical protein
MGLQISLIPLLEHASRRASQSYRGHLLSTSADYFASHFSSNRCQIETSWNTIGTLFLASA